MPNRIYFFSDLDDTLIQTKRKTDFSENPVVAAYTREGRESSYMYPGVKVFLDSLIKAGITFIPTTARNLDSYYRTFFPKEYSPKYVILNFGGTILSHGIVDVEWEKSILSRYKEVENLENIQTSIMNAFGDNEYNLSVKIVDGFYLSIHNKEFCDKHKALSYIKNILDSALQEYSDFYLHENGNSFAILPDFLNKKNAVEYLIKKDKPILTMGAGDNPSDLAFMNLTSFHMVPNSSIIFHKTNNTTKDYHGRILNIS